MSDGDVEALILLNDQQINDDLGAFDEPAPTRIRLLTRTIHKLFWRQMMRVAEKLGNPRLLQIHLPPLEGDDGVR
ncbi:MAG: hypothetical protein QXR06_03710 [Candidatus Bathyarchaeia archaeon]|nr:hypothetical protein [Candidatus Bathyarchaeota archaeon]